MRKPKGSAFFLISRGVAPNARADHLRVIIFFNFDYHVLAASQVIWAIGCMIVLAGLI
jgi:hypothetical protein